MRTEVTEVWQIMQIILKRINFCMDVGSIYVDSAELKAFVVEKQKTQDSLA
jgi:hypothetical protein